MKALVMVRASTEKQEIESQHKEMEEFLHKEGYDELIFIEDKGASAIKLNDKYKSMLAQVRDNIENDGDIKCFAVFHLNRAFRTELAFYELKQLFLDHKVQFLIKNPYLKLLNDDGTINTGAELAFSMLVTMAQQDMVEKKAKFARGVRRCRENGLYSGGCIPFGYLVRDGRFEIHPEESKVVLKMYNMYATGKYSFLSLTRELNERGVPYRDGKKWQKGVVAKILRNPEYKGEGGKQKLPAIVSKEMYQQIVDNRHNNHWDLAKTGTQYLGSRLVKCPGCGGWMYTNHNHYSCSRASASYKGYEYEGMCRNDIFPKIEVIDGLLFTVAIVEHYQYLQNLNEDGKEQYRKEIEVLKEKISAAQSAMEKIESKKKKIVDTYLEDLITKEERDAKIAKVNEEKSTAQNSIAHHTAQIENLQNLIATTPTEKLITRVRKAMSGDTGELEPSLVSEITHQHVRYVEIERYQLGQQKYPTPNSLKITITTILDKQYIYLYSPRNKQKIHIWRDGQWEKHPLHLYDARTGSFKAEIKP